MAEVQTNTETGEMVQRFIEFVMIQARNAALFLGQNPHPQHGEPEVNLDFARMFIDQLVMIRQKTRGNLSNEELAVLNNAISNLQMAFVEVSQKSGAKPEESQPAAGAEAAPEPERSAAAPEQPAADGETKKKFTKSYGS